MKPLNILLDECVDRRLAAPILGHEVRTVPQQGWAGIKNGQLLRLADSKFDVFVTVDSRLPKQQDLSKIRLSILILKARSNSLKDLAVLVPKIILELQSIEPQTVRTVGN